ncbi:hypothetical protein CGCTS75_v011989 [Colletotrichum tropicale]|nr:hypothetical protein CGCTS75_v011989 [Colletotrichum tropicale]
MASAGEFDTEEFSTNLFSDIAPLLALFGEDVTIQFLSMSMGWADDFLLAMGPVGIITTILSAIRIGGSRGLKSLVGRARETQSVAEQELLSSTSASVCELWNGQQVTRVIGEPKGMLTVIITPKGNITRLSDAFSMKESHFNIIERNNGMAIPSNMVETVQVLESRTHRASLCLPPNLSLNVRSKPASPKMLWAWAAFGVVLQALAIVYPGIATYQLKWAKDEIVFSGYGYPCFASNITPDDNDAESASKELSGVMEDIMEHLSQIDELIWRTPTGTLPTDQEHNESTRVCWAFDTREGRVSEYHDETKTLKSFHMTLWRKPGDSQWHQDVSNQQWLHAAISLSLYSDAARRMYATDDAYTDVSRTQRPMYHYQRIIGYAKPDEVAEKQNQMQEWFQAKVVPSTWSEMREEDVNKDLKNLILSDKNPGSSLLDRAQHRWTRKSRRNLAEQLARRTKTGVSKSYFGVFLSSSSKWRENNTVVGHDKFCELLIEKSSTLSAAFKFAQEILSLFILAVISGIERVDEETEEKLRVLLKHSIFKPLAKIVVRRKLAKDEDEAYTLIIPAFAKHKLLSLHNQQDTPSRGSSLDPRDLTNQQESATSELSSTVG